MTATDPSETAVAVAYIGGVVAMLVHGLAVWLDLAGVVGVTWWITLALLLGVNVLTTAGVVSS